MTTADERQLSQRLRELAEHKSYLAGLSRLRVDLERQISALPVSDDKELEQRRAHLSESIGQVDRQIDEARKKSDELNRIVGLLQGRVKA